MPQDSILTKFAQFSGDFCPDFWASARHDGVNEDRRQLDNEFHATDVAVVTQIADSEQLRVVDVPVPGLHWSRSPLRLDGRPP